MRYANLQLLQSALKSKGVMLRKTFAELKNFF